MRLALTGGGTGGHIIPALAVMEAVQARLGGTAEVCFFGPEDRGERSLVERAGVRFVGVPSAAVRGRGPLGLLRAGWRLLRGTLAAIRALRKFKPDAVFSTGGYGCLPGSVAARVLRRPLVSVAAATLLLLTLAVPTLGLHTSQTGMEGITS